MATHAEKLAEVDSAALTPPDVKIVPARDAPVKIVKADDLKQLGYNLDKLFNSYRSDRRIAELRWLRNLRQYLGIYDPEIEKELSQHRSKAYPRITRVKCISVLARIMNLMFPGNERNWELKASPSPDMDPKDISAAIEQASAQDKEAGVETELTPQFIRDAVQHLADERAAMLSLLIDDQLQEIGGDQTLDYVSLNRKVLASGILYGLGILRGPFVKTSKTWLWSIDESGAPKVEPETRYTPLFEFLPVWDFYPDMSAKTLSSMDGYFTRVVMSRAQVRELADRKDFFGDIVKAYLARTPTGNYKAQPFETELRAMGVKVNVNEMKSESTKFEVIVWNGPVSGHYLSLAGVDVPAEKMSDDIEAEIWLIEGHVIKADMNPWRKIGADIRTIHTFLFDEDDTAPIGQGLPNIVRDSQMSISAAARMLLDNASVVCGPNLELNTDLLRPDQDLASVSAYKLWYREGLGPDSQFPAVRPVTVDSHIDELLKIIELFMRFADAETFVGPATGGDMSKGVMPSEPMRTAAGASMLRGDAALPFKDIVRQFDYFTQSVINSLVVFNRKFNPRLAPAGDYNVIARGATSLIAKEVRGMQVDQLAATLSPEEKIHVDERKLVEARFRVRDMGDLLVSADEARRRKAAQAQQADEQAKQAAELAQAQVRKLLADAFKGIAQGNKNSANADAATIDAALDLLERGMMEHGLQGQSPPQTAIPNANSGQNGLAGNPGGNGAARPPVV